MTKATKLLSVIAIVVVFATMAAFVFLDYARSDSTGIRVHTPEELQQHRNHSTCSTHNGSSPHVHTNGGHIFNTYQCRNFGGGTNPTNTPRPTSTPRPPAHSHSSCQYHVHANYSWHYHSSIWGRISCAPPKATPTPRRATATPRPPTSTPVPTHYHTSCQYHSTNGFYFWHYHSVPGSPFLSDPCSDPNPPTATRTPRPANTATPRPANTATRTPIPNVHDHSDCQTHTHDGWYRSHVHRNGRIAGCSTGPDPTATRTPTSNNHYHGYCSTHGGSASHYHSYTNGPARACNTQPANTATPTPTPTIHNHSYCASHSHTGRGYTNHRHYSSGSYRSCSNTSNTATPTPAPPHGHTPCEIHDHAGRGTTWHTHLFGAWYACSTPTPTPTPTPTHFHDACLIHDGSWPHFHVAGFSVGCSSTATPTPTPTPPTTATLTPTLVPTTTPTPTPPATATLTPTLVPTATPTPTDSNLPLVRDLATVTPTPADRGRPLNPATATPTPGGPTATPTPVTNTLNLAVTETPTPGGPNPPRGDPTATPTPSGPGGPGGPGPLLSGEVADIWIWNTPTVAELQADRGIEKFSVLHSTSIEPFIVYPDRVPPPKGSTRWDNLVYYPTPIYPTPTGTVVPPPWNPADFISESNSPNLPAPTPLPATFHEHCEWHAHPWISAGAQIHRHIGEPGVSVRPGVSNYVICSQVDPTPTPTP